MSHPDITTPNQSRPRAHPAPSAGGPTTLAGATQPKIDNTAAYQGCGLDEDNIRLLEISPAASDTSPLVCTLREATFRSRPEFDALSYRWGPDDPAEKETITLNGYPFEVRRNLRDALRFLRRRTPPRQAFWIDAVCINQGDIAEKTRQLRIMDQIYFRASMVVVWLGAGKYAELQREMAGGGPGEKPEDEKPQDEEPEGMKPKDDTSKHSLSRQQELARYLRTDPYWGRLWILQEIGSARKLEVCYGEQAMPWAAFIHFLTMHNSDGKDGPLRLNTLLREEKYHGSHTLKRLLEEHRDAQCFNPRDKVYGLVGLAIDAADFPMDYAKSPYEVWKDTMEFMNRRNLFVDESQILPTGALVKSLLMASHGDPLSQVIKEHSMNPTDSTQLITDPQSHHSFRLKAIALGCVLHIGPSASEMVSSPKKVSAWRGAIQRVFAAPELGFARQEHDALLDALLRSDESEVERMCFNRPSTVIWRENTKSSLSNYDCNSRSPPPEPIQQAPDRLAPVQPRLYLVRRTPDRTAQKMGVASSLVQSLDLVCGVRSSRRALLVRVVEVGTWNTSVRVFGTALATEDLCGGAGGCDFEERWMSLGKGGNSLDVHVDAGTIFMILE
ncbi:heterokaryon incompatibility protein-domain-containing protein [Staphylotrichum tortipilum]|uniref:Heterokaryon incompatibility protein-domain-containing protein n=1 Tax=Staphylotrichum tortipilum TaxID=2831512 RepID=A0AAN6MJ12_9PEZI|nr:heterokaryon incompatibility protein-domain-containing protein [Staphylotrichum longicolle]